MGYYCEISHSIRGVSSVFLLLRSIYAIKWNACWKMKKNLFFQNIYSISIRFHQRIYQFKTFKAILFFRLTHKKSLDSYWHMKSSSVFLCCVFSEIDFRSFNYIAFAFILLYPAVQKREKQPSNFQSLWIYTISFVLFISKKNFSSFSSLFVRTIKKRAEYISNFR